MPELVDKFSIIRSQIEGMSRKIASKNEEIEALRRIVFELQEVNKKLYKENIIYKEILSSSIKKSKSVYRA